MLALLVDADPIAVWGLIVGIISALIALVAAIAAIYAAVYAKAAPTKDDLARVEENTAHLEDVRERIGSVDSRLKKQEEAEQLRLRAKRISITARGNTTGNAPFELQLSIAGVNDANFSATHVELYNERDNSFGSFPCSRTDNPNVLDFNAAIPMQAMGTWFHSGTPDQTLHRMRLKLRVSLSAGDFEVSRDMAVIVISNAMGPYPGFILDGSV